jgi:hypothetical protein
MLFMTEDDGISGLRATLFTDGYSAVVNGQRVGVLAVGGYAAEGSAAVAPPLTIAGEYKATPATVDDGDVQTLLVDVYGRPSIVGAAAEDVAAAGNPVLVGGRYDATARTLDDGDVGAMTLDVNARLVVSAPGTPITYNVNLVSADTEYSQALPANCRAVAFRCRTAYDVRFAWETGRVATPTPPYQTLKANAEYWKENIYSSGTLYFASSQAGVVVEMEAWS